MNEPLPQQSLWMADLGYFSLTLLANFSDDGVYWLTRIKSNCVLYDQEGKRFSLVEFFKKQRADKIDLPIFLGSLEKLPCRFIAVRLPEKIANQRKRRRLCLRLFAKSELMLSRKVGHQANDDWQKV